MEVFTVFLPCWGVMRHQSLHRRTLKSIVQWELKNKTIDSGFKSSSPLSTMAEQMMFGVRSRNTCVTTNPSFDERILGMSALEYCLEHNPAPLNEFSALREFSGENIAFLLAVSEWKKSLPPSIRDCTSPRDCDVNELTHEHFNRALHIYTEFVNLYHADFPINIPFKEFTKLERIFEYPNRILYGNKCEVNPIAPFATPSFSFEPPSTSSSSKDPEAIPVSFSDAFKDRAYYWGKVPEEFDASVFDDAEQSIKLLVLTNTWPKFIRTFSSSTSCPETLDTGARNQYWR